MHAGPGDAGEGQRSEGSHRQDDGGQLTLARGSVAGSEEGSGNVSHGEVLRCLSRGVSVADGLLKGMGKKLVCIACTAVQVQRILS